MRGVVVLLAEAGVFAVIFAMRCWVHRRKTGSWGYRGIAGEPGSAAWWGGALFAIAVALGFIAPLLVLLDFEAMLFAPSITSDMVGLALAIVSVTSVWWAQSTMGNSWRIGVSDGE